MQKKRARERIIMFLCIISLLFTPVLAASQSNAMRVSLDLKSATVKEFFDAVKVQTGLNFIYSTEQGKNMPRITLFPYTTLFRSVEQSAGKYRIQL